MSGSSTDASGRRRRLRRGRILAVAAGGVFLVLAVLVQTSWRLSPPAHRLPGRSTERDAKPTPARAQARAVPRSTAAAASPVVISEVSTVNHDVILDDDLAPSDWIELYNRTDQSVSLAGWRLVESGRPRRGWALPDLTLAPRAHLVVWASGKNRVGSAAGRRVNTKLTRQARAYHTVNDVHPPVPGGFWATPEARRVRVDVTAPGTGTYTLWMKARAEGLSGTVRVSVPGSPGARVTILGGRYQHRMVGREGGVTLSGVGPHGITIASVTGAVEIAHLALVRAGPPEDRYARHVHAGFRLRRGLESVALVDPWGAVRDETPVEAHAPTRTLQREPESLAWREGMPTPGGRAFRPAPDLSGYPSLTSEPIRIEPARLPGVEEVRYTLDGSVPTAHAARLDGPLRLTGPTALRLRGYAGGAPVTAVVTRQFWVGPPPGAPAVMLTLDPQLITDPEIGIKPNDRWRRQQELPDDPALGPLRLTRRRDWARERRQWIKPAHLLVVDRDGVLFDGRARVRRHTMAVGPGFGVHVRTRDPLRPVRDVFGRSLAEPGRSIVVDEDALNIPAYAAVRAAGGVAPLTRWGRLAVNGEPPSWRVLLEPVDEDMLQSRWGHARFDVLKGKTFAAKRGTTAAYDALAHRLERGGAMAADLAPLIDLPHLRALHIATLFLSTGETDESWQAYFVADHDRVPALIHAIGWDLDHAIQEGAEHDTLAAQRRGALRIVDRDTFLGVMVVLHLLDTDPAFRQIYLRQTERVMNHVLTPAWWEATRRAAGGPDDPKRAAQVARFFRERPPSLGRSLANGLGLPWPRVVRLSVEGPGALTIDGFAHQGPYVGHYFVGGTLELDVPPDRRGAFRHFTVNGRREPGPTLRLPVTDDLAVVAQFGD